MQRNEIKQISGGSSIGLIAALSAITMLFAAFSSAYIVRRGLGNDWAPLSLPKIIVLTPFLLILGSVFLEYGWKGGRKIVSWSSSTAAGLGTLFVCAQIYGWLKLSAGVRIPTHPAATFFCIFSVSFCLFVSGGIVALIASLGRGARDELYSKNVIYYWHYLSLLWLYLLGLLYWGN
jgi:cytochrome c oxidase subunit III